MKNLYQRINAVMAEISKVSKDKTVGYGKNAYKAVTHDNVTENLQPLLVKNGIVVFPSQEETTIEHYIVESKNGPTLRYETTTWVSVTFVNMDEPTERESVRVKAHGFDSQDKSCGKAYSMAVKYAFLKTFQIASGDDEEERQPTSRVYNQNAPKMATEQQKTVLRNLMGVVEFGKHIDYINNKMTMDQAAKKIAEMIELKNSSNEQKGDKNE